MNFLERFPVEICGLIAESCETPHELSLLSQQSKRCYEIFNPFLYRTLDIAALPTLATSQESRIPLNGLHPASFVRELGLIYHVDVDQSEEQQSNSLNSFRQDFVRAMANISSHGSGLRIFRLDCPILSFSEMLGNVNLSMFTRLCDVTIRCEFPKENISVCLVILVQSYMRRASLTCLELDLALQDYSPLKPVYIAQVLQQIGETCPNLTKFSINIPYPESSSAAQITSVLNSLRFPKLRILDIGYPASGLDADWDEFLLNHRKVESFRCIYHPRPLPTSAFPFLRSFEGLFYYRNSLSLEAYHRLTTLVLHLDTERDEELVEFGNTLKEMRHLQSLTISEDSWTDEWDRRGLTLYVFKTLLPTCPNLIYLECFCHLYPDDGSMDDFYQSIKENLRHIEHLKLTIYNDLPGSSLLHVMDIKNDQTMSTLTCLHSLRAIELNMFFENSLNGVLLFNMIEKNGLREAVIEEA
ncbi:hypothetical protein BT96DRAFT_1006136 [Gymnopus androsaceus JB14]|uniref:F-box domain-containing protein n=1 Tax=Gymnopus androsaceus JB14 TaxID=1447944 RepID=A0A6A4GLG1_9AGAR|nr:hypothetical protein BT96DRAFT_1006136 [Gymnopus androsaceus JB14]